MKLNLSEEELAIISDCLGDKGNELNPKFAAIQNYYRSNNEASLEYLVECLVLIEDLIITSRLQIRILKYFPQIKETHKAIEDAKENLELYEQARTALEAGRPIFQRSTISHD